MIKKANRQERYVKNSIFLHIKNKMCNRLYKIGYLFVI